MVASDRGVRGVLELTTESHLTVAGRDVVGRHQQASDDSYTRNRVRSSILHNGPSTARAFNCCLAWSRFQLVTSTT